MHPWTSELLPQVRLADAIDVAIESNESLLHEAFFDLKKTASFELGYPGRFHAIAKYRDRDNGPELR